MIEKEERQLPILRGELALLIVILINSLGVVLMLMSGSGISAISSVPYAFSLVLPRLTLGTWTYIFQGSLILFLMILVIAGAICFVILGNDGDNLELVKNRLGTVGETASGWIQSVRDSLPDGVKEKLPAGWFET